LFLGADLATILTMIVVPAFLAGSVCLILSHPAAYYHCPIYDLLFFVSVYAHCSFPLLIIKPSLSVKAGSGTPE
jgi:hypothetical protein